MAATVPMDLPWAADLATFWKTAIPFDVLIAGHCLFVAGLAPDFKGSWLVHYILTFLWGFGGGTLSSLLIMDPKAAPIALFAHNSIGIIWTICWWLITYCPGGHVDWLCKQWYVMALTKTCSTILRANLIVSRVDLAAAMFPGVAAAPLVLGSIAGCGGRLVVDALKFGWSAMPGRAELSDPGWISRSSFVAAAAYYGTAYGLGLAEPRAVAGLLVTAMVLQSLLSEPLGRPLDVTEPLADILHRISFVPKPAALVAAAAAALHSAPATPSKPRARKAVAAAATEGVTAIDEAPTPAGGVTKATRRSSRLATTSKAS